MFAPKSAQKYVFYSKNTAQAAAARQQSLQKLQKLIFYLFLLFFPSSGPH